MPYDNRNKVIPETYVLLMRGGKVLLSRRCNTGYEDGKFSVPSGHVEAGETYIEGIIREVLEEVGVGLHSEDLTCVHVMHRRLGDHERLGIYFKAETYDGEPVNAEPHKCDELQWVSLDSIPGNTIPYIKKMLENVRDGIFYDELNG